MGFWGLGCQVQGVGFGLGGLGLEFRVSCLGLGLMFSSRLLGLWCQVGLPCFFTGILIDMKL